MGGGNSMLFAKLNAREVALGLGTAFLLAACSLGGSSGNTGGASSTDVTVWTAWGGAELKAYRDVLAPFEASSGIKVHLTTNRDSNNQSANRIAAGTNLPDIAHSLTYATH